MRKHGINASFSAILAQSAVRTNLFDTEDPTHCLTHSEIADRERHATHVETSKVNVPFAMRLLSLECEAMGVGMQLRVGDDGA